MVDVINKHNEVLVRVKCPSCGNTSEVTVKTDDFNKYRNNKYAKVQDCFPYLTKENREILISGICPTCWDEIFKESDDE